MARKWRMTVAQAEAWLESVKGWDWPEAEWMAEAELSSAGRVTIGWGGPASILSGGCARLPLKVVGPPPSLFGYLATLALPGVVLTFSLSQ